MSLVCLLALFGCSLLGEEASVFYLLENSGSGQMMSCVVQTAKGKTVVIDGGAWANGPQLESFLKEKADGHVDAWLFTHPHHDHLGAFYRIFQENKGEITVDRIYHRFPSFQELVEYGYRTDSEMQMWSFVNSTFEYDFENRVQLVRSNDTIVLDELKITVLRVYNPSMTANFVNNSSVVYRLENDKSSFLILGDLGVEGGEELMKNCPKELLETDYTQMAHHGQKGVSKEFYEYIRPKRCIWPTPEWLWNNDKGNGFDTGPYETVRTREWMEELGVIEHYIAKDGTQKIKF